MQPISNVFPCMASRVLSTHTLSRLILFFSSGSPACVARVSNDKFPTHRLYSMDSKICFIYSACVGTRARARTRHHAKIFTRNIQILNGGVLLTIFYLLWSKLNIRFKSYVFNNRIETQPKDYFLPRRNSISCESRVLVLCILATRKMLL